MKVSCDHNCCGDRDSGSVSSPVEPCDTVCVAHKFVVSPRATDDFIPRCLTARFAATIRARVSCCLSVYGRAASLRSVRLERRVAARTRPAPADDTERRQSSSACLCTCPLPPAQAKGATGRLRAGVVTSAVHVRLTVSGRLGFKLGLYLA